MKRRHTGLFIVSWLVFIAVIGVPLVTAQAAGDVPLQVHLRYSDGTAVSGEPIRLQRLPDGEETTCTTDKNGRCSWTVERGLYQVIFSQSLDPVSALAVAESGLDGFGLTVGDTPITYHFTFHHDAHVYFDAAPEAAVPEPIIPTADSLHGGVVPTAIVPTAVSTTVAMATVTPLSEEGAPSQAMPLSDEADGAATGDVIPPIPPFLRLIQVILIVIIVIRSYRRLLKRQQAAEQAAEQTAMAQQVTVVGDSPQAEDVSATDFLSASSPKKKGGSEC